MNDLVTPRYDFLAPRRIVFGWGRRKELGALARDLGSRAFLVHGSRTLESSGVLDGLEASLRESGLEVQRAGSTSREPEVDDVDRATGQLRAQLGGSAAGAVVIALGGGSALDLAKAVSAMAVQPGDASVRDYLEGVGKNLRLERDPLPLIALPTTAGTGSEATKNAVISCREPAFKKSLRSDKMVPSLVLLDPELQVTVPPSTTAYTGLDALTQCIESFLSSRRAPLPRALALDGARLAAASLERAFLDGSDRPAREAMAHAALLSGMALANSGLGLAHGVAAALGIHAGVAHGLACALMLPTALRVNRGERLEDLARLATEVCGRTFPTAAAGADALVERIEALSARLGIPARLGEVGVRREQLGAIVKSSYGNSMSGNPRNVTEGELLDLLEGLL